MLNEQKGFMSFIVLILGVSVVIGIALFSLNMQSRETFFLVHYYYLDSAREQLAKSIQAESHDWIKNEMESTESAARKSILEKFMTMILKISPSILMMQILALQFKIQRKLQSLLGLKLIQKFTLNIYNHFLDNLKVQNMIQMV